MKDLLLYIFLFAVYAILALNFFQSHLGGAGTALSWQALGWHFVVLCGAAAVARWSVLAFKRRPQGLIAGQKIVGIEEEEPNVLDVIQPQQLKREQKKPKLRRPRRR